MELESFTVEIDIHGNKERLLVTPELANNDTDTYFKINQSNRNIGVIAMDKQTTHWVNVKGEIQHEITEKIGSQIESYYM